MKNTKAISRLRDDLLTRAQTLHKSLHDEFAMLGEHDDEDSYEEDLYSQLAATEFRELRAIEDALQRIRAGEYGECESCGGEIALARLEALPCATLCINCQREEEQSGHGRSYVSSAVLENREAGFAPVS